MRNFLLTALVLTASLVSAYEMDKEGSQIILSTTPSPVYMDVINGNSNAFGPPLVFVEGRVSKDQFDQIFENTRNYLASVDPGFPLSLHEDSSVAIMVRGRTTGCYYQYSMGVHPFILKGLAKMEVYNRHGAYRYWYLVLENEAWSRRYYKSGEIRPYYLLIGRQVLDFEGYY